MNYKHKTFYGTHHLIRCQTVTLCRGSWPRTPSRLKTNDPANPGHEVPLYGLK